MDPALPPSSNPLNRFKPNPIPPTPNPLYRGSGHRRHHSETLFRYPDDLLFDSDPDFNISDIDLPSLSDEVISFAPDRPTEASPAAAGGGGAHHHGRSVSVDAAFFEGMGLGFGGGTHQQESHHKRSGSMDEGDSSTATSSDYAKKAMAADKLAELALIDPRRAKRILANRQSAARSKERKVRYASELERKVQTLQTEATTLSAQFTLLQRDTTGLTAENRELKLRLQAMEQQAHLRDALNEALREEVQHLKIATGQIPNINGNNAFNRGFFSQPPQLSNSNNAHQTQQLQNTSRSNGQSHSDRLQNDFM